MQAYERLEKEFGEWAGVPNVVACSSGTAALHLALEALQLPSGSEVIVPDFTMIACARAVSLAGLVPVFVDCGRDLLVRPDLIRKAVGPSTRAIMVVHVYGRRCDMEVIHKIAEEFDLYVIEDLAEAHGVRPHPRTFASCWSFYSNKIIGGQEGGAVALGLNVPEIDVEYVRKLRCLGFTDAHDFSHIPRGHNYRMSNLHAAYILDGAFNINALRWAKEKATLGRNPNLTSIELRREDELKYNRHCIAEWRMPDRDAPWVYDLRIPGMTRERQHETVKALNDAGIKARHGFKPMSNQLEYCRCRKVLSLGEDGLSEAERASQEVIYLPLTPGEVTEETAAKAFEIIASINSINTEASSQGVGQ